MRRKLWVLALPFFFAPAWALSPFAGADQKADAPKEVPKEVRALEGAYTGSWTMYGIDEKGDVVKRMAWTDTMKAVGPEVRCGAKSRRTRRWPGKSRAGR